ncbi:hypothetical protein ACFL51_01045 [Myxococcota bacterium]
MMIGTATRFLRRLGHRALDQGRRRFFEGSLALLSGLWLASRARGRGTTGPGKPTVEPPPAAPDQPWLPRHELVIDPDHLGMDEELAG